MTYISPLLQNRIAQPSNKTQLDNHHEKIYQDLQKHANDVKPNEAKAKMVSQNPITRAMSTVVDTGKDCVNFAKAVTTGKMSDNNLGRINDLGMKAGALLIATYLASQAKTKTDKIMQFVGGGAFIASMTLWPKLFINLPARLVHGFNIDQKYINAQGDKKDFFLDNQFIPWDAYSKEELEKIGKRTGIDYNSENGEEKIKRKMQKTALQNRTLWMATAGFATPLMTAMIGSVVQPKIKDAVVENGFKKAKESLQDQKKLAEILGNAKADVRNVKDIGEILKNFNATKESFTDLSSLLQITAGLGKEEATTLRAFSSGSSLKETLTNLYSQQTTLVAPKDKTMASVIEEALNKLGIITPEATQKAAEEAAKEAAKEAAEGAAEAKSIVNIGFENAKPIGKKATQQANNTIIEARKAMAKEIAEAMNSGDNKNSIEALRTAVGKEESISLDFDTFLAKLKELDVTVDDSKFKKSVTEFNEGALASARGRIKAYIELINSVFGSTAESKTTKEYTSIIENYIKALGFDYNGLKSAKSCDDHQMQEKLIAFFKSKAESKDYDSFIKTFFTKQDEGLSQAIEKAISDANIQEVANVKGKTNLLEAALGGNEGLRTAIRNYANTKTADLDAIRLRGIWCAELERMIKNGQLKGDEVIATARGLLYRGTISAINNNIEATLATQETIKNVLFNADNYSEAALKTAGFRQYIEQMKTIKESDSLTNAVKNNLCPNFTEAMKKRMTSLFNDKTWMKRFGIMSAVLVGVTLLAQPFFGKIKHEFPDKKQGGAN